LLKNIKKSIKMKTLTLEEAKNLTFGTVLFHTIHKNSDGTAQRWKVNGKVQTLKRKPEKVKIPIKMGLYSYDYITELDLNLVTLIEPERVKK